MEEEDTNRVPLIVRQRPRNLGASSKLVPYKPPADTYDLFSNPKSPFLERLVTATTEQTKLSSEKLQNLFDFRTSYVVLHFARLGAVISRPETTTLSYVF